jgi:predicted outer membrane repeat protein
VIVHNKASYDGGGIHCWTASPLITLNRFVNNTGGSGGGVYCEYFSYPDIRSNVFRGNTSTFGGAVHCQYGSSPTISDNLLFENSALRGGGIYYINTSPWILHNAIISNFAQDGGGIHGSSDYAVIRGNTIAGNTAHSFGGGIRSSQDLSVIESNTVVGNTAWRGGGLVCADASPAVTNCILWGNDPDQIEVYDNEAPVVNYCDVEGGWEGEGNIEAYPQFIMAERNDYRLFRESPCIDSGHPDKFDADGTRSDIGAHSFDQGDDLTLYLTPATRIVAPGDTVDVLYTVINGQPEKVPFTLLTRVLLPDSSRLDIYGPEQYTICAGYTAQASLPHWIPPCAGPGFYTCESMIGLPPSTLYDEDSFRFLVMP